jgi:hypothetical protein
MVGLVWDAFGARAGADAGRPPSPRLSPVLCHPPCMLIRWRKAAPTTVAAQKIGEGQFLLTTTGGGKHLTGPVRFCLEGPAGHGCW